MDKAYSGVKNNKVMEMGQINIESSFEYADGYLNVILSDRSAYVTFDSGDNTVVIEDSCGSVVDWYRLYQREWLALSGAALESSEQAFAKKYAIEALGEWVVFTADQIKEMQED